MRPLLLSCYLLFSITGLAQQMAVTDTGEKVILYNDGTWAYAERDSIKAEEIPTNPKKFSKKKDADFLLKSERTLAGFWLDPKAWTFTTPEEPGAAEYELDHKNGSLYGMIISEKLDLPLISLGNIAIQNAREAAPDIKVIAKEYRTVNGKQVLMMRMTGTISDIRFSYFGYYYAEGGDAIQYLVYSSEMFMEENLEVVEDLLNGLVGSTE